MKSYILLLITVFVFLSCSNIDNSKNYTILTVNSMNGQIFPHETNGLKTGGFSLLSSKVKEIRNNPENGEVMLFGNSNFIYGQAEAYFTSGKAVIDIMNKVGFNGLIIGHREFYFGLEILEVLSKEAKFPFISANIVKKDSTRFDFIKPYYILSDKKTAIIGVSSDKVFNANLEKDVNRIMLLDAEETITKYSKILRDEGIKKIIVIGDFQCSADVIPSSIQYEFSEVIDNGSIDVFIGTSCEKDREDAKCICQTVKKTKILSCDIDCKELLYYRFNDQKQIESDELFKINSEKLQPDPQLSKQLYELNQLVNEIAGEVLGNSEEDIKHLEGGVFKKESHLGDFISDVIRDYTKTDIVLLNSGKIRNGFLKGPITLMDLYNVIPYEGTIVKMSLTGKQLLKILESSCALKMSKSFLQVSGIKFKFDSSREIFKRVIDGSVFINGEKLDLNRVYSVALTKYIFDGGDQYTEFSKMNIELEMVFQKQMREVLKQYIQLNKTVKCHPNSRVIEINNGAN